MRVAPLYERMATMADVLIHSADTGAAQAEPADPQLEVIRLFGLHGAALYRFCRSMIGAGGEAEDVVQDTFVKLVQHLHSAGDRTNLKAWLFTVAANGCRDRIRRRSRWLPWSAELDRRVVPPVAEPPDVAAARRALLALAPRDRLLLSLRAQGLSYADIARAAGIRSTSVGRLLARAVDRWKRSLEENHDALPDRR